MFEHLSPTAQIIADRVYTFEWARFLNKELPRIENLVEVYSQEKPTPQYLDLIERRDRYRKELDECLAKMIDWN